jgi:hypothetical protein
MYAEGRDQRWARVASRKARVARGGPAPPWHVDPLAPLDSSFWFRESSGKI